MKYTNRADRASPRPARKFCYIIKCGDLQAIFANAGVTLVGDVYNMHSYWNRRHPKQEKEYGVEICQDDNGSPVYLVYDKHWHHGRAEAQHKIYADKITPAQAVKLDALLITHDVP